MSTSKSIDDVVRELDAEIERPRRRRRWLWLTMVVVVAGGAGGGYYWFVMREPATDTSDEPTGPAATAEVVSETMSDTETWGGVLGNGNSVTVTTAGQGVITRLTDPDSKVERGTQLYRLNEQPVTALIGDIPMYRDLTSGAEGVDVEQLEANLSELGYDGFDVDDEFNYYTAAAVEEWQEDIDAEETGMVKATDVVFVPKAAHVDNVHAEVGASAAPGTEVLDIAGSEDVVTLEVDLEQRDLMGVGTNVSVTLPGGKDVKAEVTAATVVEGGSEGEEGAAGADEAAGADDATVEVEVTLNKAVDESLADSPVDIVAKVDEREDVLAVPITALLAMSEGGYGLEVVAADKSTSIVPVEAGLFADGKVEVSGSGIAEGTVVGVAGSE